MTNADLRTRIAAVLYHRWWESSMSLNEPPRWNQLSQSARDKWLQDADAVIRELNLATACQSGCMWQIPNRVEDMTDAQKQLLKIAEPPSWGTPSFDNGSRDD